MQDALAFPALISFIRCLIIEQGQNRSVQEGAMPADWCMPDGATVSTSLAGLNRMLESHFTARETDVGENVDADAAR